MNQAALDLLLTRSSVAIQELKEPGPSESEIDTILRIASRVPDHGRLAPWRFILYRGDARREAGKLLADLAETREGPLSDVRRDQELARFSRAPLVIGIVSVPKAHPKIPDWEKFLSGGAAAMNLTLAATALGYRTSWVTNWFADVPEGRAILGLAPDERVIGFIHIGTFKGEFPDRSRPDVEALRSDYTGPWRG